ncbi:MAG: hypothetical protein NXI15_03345 [Gammaproteobacteria bacterium]|nr:hypothetical protein [Gammaproteobacteria bacterium]
MKDADKTPRQARGLQSTQGERIDALVRREGFALDQDVLVTDLLSNAGEASDLPDALYVLLAEICSCLYHLEAAASPAVSEPVQPPSGPARPP